MDASAAPGADATADDVELIVAHSQRATLRVGDLFLKIDGDPAHADREIRSMELAPVPTPVVRWDEPPVLAVEAVRGTPLGTLGGPSTASGEAWSAVGATLRRLHEVPLPPWSGRSTEEIAAELDRECAALLAEEVLPPETVRVNREIAEAALHPARRAFIHGDLQICHVFTEGDEVTGIIDWSEGGPGDPMEDLAVLTLGHEERLDALLAGYGPGAGCAAIRGWWSLRGLVASRWLLAHGFDPDAPGCEFDVLRERVRERRTRGEERAPVIRRP